MVAVALQGPQNNISQYIQSLINARENKKNLGGKNKLVLPVAKTAPYDLRSTSYIAAKAWNALPDNLRSLAEFGIRIAQSQNPNVYKHYKQLTRWNANRCHSLRTTYLIFETFQILFLTASLIFTAVKLFHEVI